MNIIKNPDHVIASIIFINDDSSEYIENLILDLNKISDIYVFINKKSDIDPDKYSHLLPIKGYQCHKSDFPYNSLDLYTMTKYILKVIDHYERYVILGDIGGKISSEKIRDSIFNVFKSIITKSILNLEIIDHTFRKDLYSKKKTLFSRKLDMSGVNITHKSSNNIYYLSKDDISRICGYLNSDNKYLETFKNINFNYLIPSIVKKLDIDYMNSDILNIDI